MRRVLCVVAAMSLAAVTACGSDDSGSTEETAEVTTEASPTTSVSSPSSDTVTSTTGATESSSGSSGDAAEVEAMRADLAAAAVEEGKVTFYTSLPPEGLAAIETAFEAKYPDVDLEVIRMNSPDISATVDVELDTGQGIADFVQLNDYQWVHARGAEGKFVPATASPAIAGLDEYDADRFAYPEGYFQLSGTVLALAWNTEELPDGLAEFEDLLDPSLQGGKVGIQDPALGGVAADYFYWNEQKFGADFLEALAEQQPAKYRSTTQITEALGSGELWATNAANPSQLIAAQAEGAPVDYMLPASGAYGVPHWGLIPTTASHPNAAALLGDFLVSREGQSTYTAGLSSVLPGIEGALTTNDTLALMDLARTDPEVAEPYTQHLVELFS
jgi:iron(III) transport system substrate-binding protein